ncbi:ExbD/TolR family protein [Marinobacterium sedimentorum]|uniref:ExbD/TolR family protein n=1 Tax=Marinobacterium sedimentorum TaxID=2927804 RepID=UPI0020C5FEC4|nr:biopolymer transporter ExbD [Marinobacterium sedimentorum]MCP8687569.1 biopolymer transporter ExbD [Marinobacterium sedimentorum]
MKFAAQTSPHATNRDDNLIPLINVVFLMLIFFMVAGKISHSDAIAINPPASTSETTASSKEPIRILLSATGVIYMDDMALESEQLTNAVTTALDNSHDPQGLSILLKVDAATPVDTLLQTLEQIKAAGMLKISLATRVAERPA